MPTEPVEYQHLLRGPRRAGWQPLVCGLAVGAIWFGVAVVLGVGILAATLAAGKDVEAIADDFADPLNGSDSLSWPHHDGLGWPHLVGVSGGVTV